MCCSSLLKLIMFIFNGIIFLAGAAILGIGIWVTVDSSSLLSVLSSLEDIPPELMQVANVGYLLIAVGSILTIMGFLGCYGAMTENKCMLLTFFIILLVIFIAEVAGAVVVLVFQPLTEDLLNGVSEKIVNKIRNEYGNDSKFTELLNSTMNQLECCGYNNHTDFTNSPFVTNQSVYPVACCINQTTVCDFDAAQGQAVIGCFKKLSVLIEENSTVIAAVALGIAALEIAAMTVSMILYNRIGK